MLHKRELPDNEFEDLNKVYRIKRKLLYWLLRTPPTESVSKENLEDLFGKKLGSWFWMRIRQPSKRTQFGQAIDMLAAKARSENFEAKQVASAIRHDAQFHQKWHSPGFELKFPGEFNEWLDSIKAVAEPFYDWLASEKGFAKDVFGLTGGDMTRSKIMQAYRPQSLGICGYCDGPLGEIGSKADANDCEHFFPKSKWPHLAIHPANLFTSCKGCNETWKLDKTPMGNADEAGIRGTYHPSLLGGASLISVVAKQSPDHPMRVCIEIRDESVPERAQTLVETLDLEARWSNDVNEKMDGRGVSVFVSKAFQDRFRGQAPVEAEIDELLDDSIIWARKNISKEERSIRLAAALQYQKDCHLAQIIQELL
ncbi:hypothetical protein [Methylomonas methanica]|uniref:HNH endonuclease n=1 Tax=Methylomonas methanica (strain DSM 25384 / MC09) TaxID=857087 RepID=G0A4S4_METMM|nr:hypothetical protein [Methylomonas methanica]AEG02815.1 hypothetical protein Metme_4473 [Methylomonas methanica MC09]